MSKFIVIEGVEGSGKTTQIEHLKKLYPDAVFTHEPGGTIFGEQVRETLFRNIENTDAISQVYLMHAGRWQNIIENIQPALEEGKVVFCDRFQLSTYAYQIVAPNRPDALPHMFETQAQFLDAGINPHYIFLDVEPKQSLSRLEGRENNNVIDKLGLEFHQTVYQGYKEGITELGVPCTLIDASKSLEEVQADVVQTVKEILES